MVYPIRISHHNTIGAPERVGEREKHEHENIPNQPAVNFEHDFFQEEMREHIRQHHDKAKKDYTDAELNYLIKPFDVEPTLIPANNILRDPNNFAPEKDFIWDILRVSGQVFSAGTVSVYLGAITETELFVINPAGSYWFGDHQLLATGKNKTLVFQAAGLSGNAYVSCSGISIHRHILGRYLMAG
jgi:hypothetical protein